MYKLQIPEQLIEELSDTKIVSSLVFFTRCKGLHQNNTIYAYTPRNLSQRLNCSIGKVKHHIKILESVNLVRFTNKNLTFVRVSQKHKSTVIIEKTDTDKEIKYKLYAKLLERNVRQQIWISGRKAEVRNKHQVKSLTQLKSINKMIKNGLLEKPHRTEITLSLKSINSILGVSQRTAVNIRGYLEGIRYITLRTITDKVKKMSLQAFTYSKDLFPSCYWYRGMVYKPNASTVTLGRYYGCL